MQAILDSTMVSQPVVSLRYRVGSSPEAWVLPEGTVPESTAHDGAVNRIQSILGAWAARVGNGARIARNLAVRWLPKYPSTGLDPDVCVLLPGPADFDDLSSYRVWERPPPPLAFEVVSASHPYKDYRTVHEGYAAMGVLELVVFDPQLFGPKALGGPVLLQLWRRDTAGALERVHFGNDPVYSNVLEAWLGADGRDLVISDDRAGRQRWPTEAARLESVIERVQAQAERVQLEKAELEQRVAELEAALAKK
jgi:Uma2 family endonuclease